MRATASFELVIKLNSGSHALLEHQFLMKLPSILHFFNEGEVADWIITTYNSDGVHHEEIKVNRNVQTSIGSLNQSCA